MSGDESSRFAQRQSDSIASTNTGGLQRRHPLRGFVTQSAARLPPGHFSIGVESLKQGPFRMLL